VRESGSYPCAAQRELSLVRLVERESLNERPVTKTDFSPEVKDNGSDP